MAAMALQLRSKCRTLRNPSFVELFSSSSSSDSSGSNDGEDKKESQSPPSPPSPPSFSSYFSDVKASLKQTSPPRRVPPPSPSTEPPSFASLKPSKVASLEEIRKNLSEFRRRSAVPPPGDKSASSSSQAISFQDLYRRNVIEKSDGASSGVAGGSKSGKVSFDAIRESLRQLRSSTPNQSANERFRGPVDKASGRGLDTYSLKAFKDSLKMKPDDPGKRSNIVLGGTETLPTSVFAKELGPKSEAESQALKTEFLRVYNYDELGDKLRKLRPADAEGFSLGELNERLRKLREMEEKELDSRMGGVSFKDLRESLVKLRMSTDDKTKKSSLQRLDILGHLGGTPSFMLSPPKEHLVEKYFHPDNMSSKEKLKLELNRVRDEFKMSESDCGSSRVQVAQLTTKIKHLSAVLSKKDKHSKKGLLAMVQRRKKLLKYLRKTDWDSYCFVISKLGLRDNPDYKH